MFSSNKNVTFKIKTPYLLQIRCLYFQIKNISASFYWLLKNYGLINTEHYPILRFGPFYLICRLPDAFTGSDIRSSKKIGNSISFFCDNWTRFGEKKIVIRNNRANKQGCTNKVSCSLPNSVLGIKKVEMFFLNIIEQFLFFVEQLDWLDVIADF